MTQKERNKAETLIRRGFLRVSPPPIPATHCVAWADTNGALVPPLAQLVLLGDLVISPPAGRPTVSFRAPKVTNRNEKKAAQARARSNRSYRRRTVDSMACYTVEAKGAVITRIVRDGFLPDAMATNRKAVEEALSRWIWFITTLK